MLDPATFFQCLLHPDPIPLLGVNVALLQRLMNEGENDHIVGMRVFKC